MRYSAAMTVDEVIGRNVRYATTVHRGSRDVLSVQRLLGHSSPETTLAYVTIDDDDLWDAAGWAA